MDKVLLVSVIALAVALLSMLVNLKPNKSNVIIDEFASDVIE